MSAPALCRWHVVDPFCEKYYDVSPYAMCANDPINNYDPDGKFIETLWDVVKVVYDVGTALYNHAKGNHESASSNWADAGLDLAATIIPGISAGGSKLVKGAKTFQSNVKAGKNFERFVVKELEANGHKISTQTRLVPKNGKGNVKGNRTNVDALKKNEKKLV